MPKRTLELAGCRRTAALVIEDFEKNSARSADPNDCLSHGDRDGMASGIGGSIVLHNHLSEQRSCRWMGVEVGVLPVEGGPLVE